MTHPLSTRLSAVADGHRGRLAQSATEAGPGLGMVLGAAVLLCGVGLAMLLLRRGRLRRRRSQLAAFAVIVVGAVLAGTAVSREPDPAVAARPGVPLLAGAETAARPIPVAVVPNRPGFNLVGVAADRASAGTDPARLSAGRRYAGSGQTWVGVTLGAGEQRLHLSVDGLAATLDVDTGHDPGPRTAALRGTDGPECAAAAIGTLIAGGERPLTACPADRLTDEDAAVLRSTVHFIAARGSRTVALRGDDSPRARAAAGVVREAAARERLTVVAPGRGRAPLLVVAGWAAAEAQVEEVGSGRIGTAGTYLAPWLLSRPVLGPSAGQLIPLRYDPRGPAANRYLAALTRRLPGELPSAAGYEAWQRQRGDDFRPAVLYAAAEVYVPGMPAEHQHSQSADWLASGMIAPASGPLQRS
ncbi:hypothetical protein ACGFZL_23515 [Streptomyces sp. NPDC048182]|uniref:hypothetical protein n=1 Tax=Streptomyces sp. NPDC048182 TaxID=3365507 RepID=UPI00371AC33E